MFMCNKFFWKNVLIFFKVQYLLAISKKKNSFLCYVSNGFLATNLKQSLYRNEGYDNSHLYLRMFVSIISH